MTAAAPDLDGHLALAAAHLAEAIQRHAEGYLGSAVCLEDEAAAVITDVLDALGETAKPKRPERGWKGLPDRELRWSAVECIADAGMYSTASSRVRRLRRAAGLLAALRSRRDDDGGAS